MTYVRSIEDGDAVVLQWGDGETHAFRPGDDASMWEGYRKAVAHGLAAGASGEMDDAERSVAREMQGALGIRKDAADSMIVGWFPSAEGCDDCVALAYTLSAICSGNVSPADIHLTLLYLGDPDADGSGPWDPQLISAVLKIFTCSYGTLDGCISGIGRFVGPGDTDVIVALVDIPYLGNLRHSLKDELCYQGALPYNSPVFSETHGFVPHITLGYIPKTQASPAPLTETIPICIDSLSLAIGSAQICYPLLYAEDASEDMTPYFAARNALDLVKAGRVLSGKNLDGLDAAIATLQSIADQERTRNDQGDSGLSTPGATAPEETAKRREFFETVMAEGNAPLTYVVTKSSEEQRYTLGPLYAPDRKDAHGDFTDADTLQKSVWDYVRQSSADGRRLNLQHGDLGNIQVAEWVEVMAWPMEHTIKVAQVGGEERELQMPAGTVYVGAIWDEDAWPLVKSGKLGGWSLGGMAIRVAADGVDLPPMGDKIAAARPPATPAPIAPVHVHVAAPAAPVADDGTVDAALELTAKLSATTAERDALAAETAAGRGLLNRVIGVFEKQAERASGDTHMHLPAHDVTVHTPEVHVGGPTVTINEESLAPDPPEDG